MYWRDVMAEAAASGLSQRAFCRQRGIAEPVFYYWRRILADLAPTALPADRSGVRFALVEPCAVASSRASSVSTDGAGEDANPAAKMELLLDRGWRLRIACGADEATLCTVLAALDVVLPNNAMPSAAIGRGAARAADDIAAQRSGQSR